MQHLGCRSGVTFLNINENLSSRTPLKINFAAELHAVESLEPLHCKGWTELSEFGM